MLRRLLISVFAVAVLAAASYASADDGEKMRRYRRHGGGLASGQTSTSEDTGPRSIPEFDPATAGVIAALVGGGALLIARRRKA